MSLGKARGLASACQEQSKDVPERVASRMWMAVVEYDGTEYLGFQIQRTGRTVQGELERAIAQVTQHTCRVVGAGRTDTGVHALGQMIHFRVPWRHEPVDLQRALNAVLAEDVAIRELSQAPPGFHSRFSARSRQYRYTVYDCGVRSPLLRHRACHCGRPLDEEMMDRACRCLVGRHDFLPFGWPPGGENTVRNVFSAGVRREGDTVVFDIEADAFLRRMVRRLAGNLILVGTGALSVEGFAELMTLRHRRTPAVDAPPQGLCLVHVNY